MNNHTTTTGLKTYLHSFNRYFGKTRYNMEIIYTELDISYERYSYCIDAGDDLSSIMPFGTFLVGLV